MNKYLILAISFFLFSGCTNLIVKRSYNLRLTVSEQTSLVKIYTNGNKKPIITIKNIKKQKIEKKYKLPRGKLTIVAITNNKKSYVTQELGDYLDCSIKEDGTINNSDFF